MAVADAYGWDSETAETVYIATGLEFPDSLVLGLSAFDDGPLLLVRPDGIPLETRNALAALEPCYIDVIGGEAAVSNDVWQALATYIDLNKCAV